MNRRKKAFTLIELLVVILILAILAALIVPRVVNKTSDAKRSKAASDISSLHTALNSFRLDCDRFPTSEEGLTALRSQPADVPGWRGPYLDKPLPPDPWGNEYYYCLLYTSRSGIEIDWCPQCKGVWLDRGELEKLMDREDDGPRFDRDDDGDDRRRGGRRRGGFLGDVFDIFD